MPGDASAKLARIIEELDAERTISARQLRQLDEAKNKLVCLTEKLATERTFGAQSMIERDDAIRESARRMAELATGKALSRRLLQTLDSPGRTARQHVYLSSYLGDYTSAFLDSKTCCERATLLGCIRATTKMVWDSGAAMPCHMTTKVIRTMLAEHGFVFRDPGEGATGWAGYATMVPDLDPLEQLDRVVRTHRRDMNVEVWYLTELVGVMIRIAKYLEENL